MSGDGSDRTFVIGLALAGAISAGAYTAGVLDFLIEALEEWEAARKRGEPVPTHRVAISAISGTSAGGICAPLLAAALAHSDKPVKDTQGRTRAYLPRLYDAWVTQTKLFADREGDISFTSDEDLSTGDARKIDYAARALRKQKRVKSLLNGALLERIATKALTVTGNPPTNPPPRPYVSKNLHLFLMTGNLRGVPYGVSFAQKQKHGMVLHADKIHAAVSNLGSHENSSKLAGRERASIALDARSLGNATALDPQWERVRIAALATCAFPAGLPSRIVRETGADKANLVWPISSGYQDADPAYPNFVPDWPGAAPDSYSYVSADGGIANNEPFEYARWSIMERPPERNERDEKTADRAIIMIDPFPEPPEFDLGPDDDSMVATLQRLIATLIDQARFKFVELAEAQSEGVASRYLIAPSRPAANAQVSTPGASLQTGINAIATGLIGGFGGFVAETLRDHDYQLGRRNCQLFLREHFALPEDNRLIVGNANSARFATTTPGARQGIRYFQLIPLVGSAAVEAPEPRWPRLDKSVIDKLMRAAGRRLDRVVPVLLKDELAGIFAGLAASVVWPLVRGGILDRIRAAVMSDVIRRDQYTETQALSDTERRLLGLMYADFAVELTQFGLARRYAEHVTSKGGEALPLSAIAAALDGRLAPFVTKVGTRGSKDLSGRDVTAEAYQVKEFAPGFWDRVKAIVDAPPVD